MNLKNKKCNICGQLQDINFFSIVKKRKSGIHKRRGYCKKCQYYKREKKRCKLDVENLSNRYLNHELRKQNIPVNKLTVKLKRQHLILKRNIKNLNKSIGSHCC